MTDYNSIVKAGSSSGIGWFDIYESGGEGISLSYKNNRAHSVRRGETSGTGIRININGRTGFSYTNNPKKINEAIRAAVESAPFGEEEDLPLPGHVDPRFEPYNDSIEGMDLSSQVDMIENVIDCILQRYPDASVDAGVSASSGKTRLVNSSGFDASYRNSFFSASVSVTIINEKGERLEVYENISRLCPEPFDFLTDNLLKKIDDAAKPASAESGRLPVIFTPSAFARLISIVTSGLNGKSVYRGISPFAGKLGEKIFNERLTLLNSPAEADSPFSFPFDDEGVPAEDFFIIEKGAPAAYAVDLKYAGLLKTAPLPCASRGYSSLPSPSFGPVHVSGGERPLSSLIEGVRQGLFVDQFIGFGQSNTLTGDFNANLNLAYLIENGEIAGRVKDSMIADNIFDLLRGDFELSLERETRSGIILPWVIFPSVNYVG